MNTWVNKEIKIDEVEIHEMICELGVMAEKINQAEGLKLAKGIVGALVYSASYTLTKENQVVRINELIKQLEEAKAKL